MEKNEYPCEECNRKTCSGVDCERFLVWFKGEWRVIRRCYQRMKKEREENERRDVRVLWSDNSREQTDLQELRERKK